MWVDVVECDYDGDCVIDVVDTDVVCADSDGVSVVVIDVCVDCDIIHIRHADIMIVVVAYCVMSVGNV